MSESPGEGPSRKQESLKLRGPRPRSRTGSGGILRLDINKPYELGQVDPPSPVPSVDRLSVTFATEDRSGSSDASTRVNLYVPGTPPISRMEKVRFPTITDGEDSDEDYSASVTAIMQRRASTRKSRRKSRRTSSPFSHEQDGIQGIARRRSSCFTSSSGDTAISMEESLPQEVTQEQIFENIRLHKEVLSSVKMQPWGMRRKLKLVQQAKSYIKRHRGVLQERLAQSRSTKDILARWNIYLVQKWQHYKRELANLSNWLIPWESRIKEIESHFGSVVASYFTFLRWLFWVNLIISVVLMAFIAIPELLTADPKAAGERKVILPEEKAKASNLLTLWDFEGVLKYSPMFYGYYTNRDDTDKGYRLPFAYFMTGLGVYVYSFVATLRKMAENSRMSKLSEKDDECVFSWKLFTGWDYMIGNAETAHNRVASIILGFKEALLEEAEKMRQPRNWKIISIRILVNFFVLLLLGVSAYVVVLVVQRSTEPDSDRSWWRRNEITVVMSLISLIFPIFFELLGLFEHYHPRKQLRLQLARIMVLNLLNLYSLIFALFDKIGDMTVDLQKLKENKPEVEAYIAGSTEILSNEVTTPYILDSTTCINIIVECANSSSFPELTSTTVISILSNLTTLAILLSNKSLPDFGSKISTPVYNFTTFVPENLTEVPNFIHINYAENMTFTSAPNYTKLFKNASTYNFGNEIKQSSTEPFGETTFSSTDMYSTSAEQEMSTVIDDEGTFSSTMYSTSAEEDVSTVTESLSTTADYTYGGDYYGDYRDYLEDAAPTNVRDNRIENTENIEYLITDSTESTTLEDTTFDTTENEYLDSTTESLETVTLMDTDLFESTVAFTTSSIEDIVYTVTKFLTSSQESTYNATENSFSTLSTTDILYVQTTISSILPILDDTLRLTTTEIPTELTTLLNELNTTISSLDHNRTDKSTCVQKCVSGEPTVPEQSKNLTTTDRQRLKTNGTYNYELRKKLRSLCWETMFGQELVKLTVMDLVFTIISTLAVDFFRALFVRFMNNCWCWDLEKQFPQYGDFKIAENILHLVNNQGQVWMGMFFSPGLTLINLAKLAIMMYLRSWAVLTCNVPHEVVFRASRSNNFYLALLLTMLFLCVLPVGYAIVWVEPSWHCGPFSNYGRIYHIFTQSLQKALPKSLHRAMDYIASPGIVIPLLVLLVLIIYYMISLTNALREANNDLKLQLRRERTEERRKMFQMADRRRRNGSGDSGDLENTTFGKWKKLLPNLPNSKSFEDGSNKEKEVTENKNEDNKKDFLAKFIKRALKKNTTEENNPDDGTDTEVHDSLPDDVNTNLREPKEKNPKVLTNFKKLINASASKSPNEPITTDTKQTQEQTETKTDTTGPKIRDKLKKNHLSSSRSSSSKDLRQDSVTSVWSDNIPVIKISNISPPETNGRNGRKIIHQDHIEIDHKPEDISEELPISELQIAEPQCPSSSSETLITIKMEEPDLPDVEIKIEDEYEEKNNIKEEVEVKQIERKETEGLKSIGKKPSQDTELSVDLQKSTSNSDSTQTSSQTKTESSTGYVE